MKKSKRQIAVTLTGAVLLMGIFFSSVSAIYATQVRDETWKNIYGLVIVHVWFYSEGEILPAGGGYVDNMWWQNTAYFGGFCEDKIAWVSNYTGNRKKANGTFTVGARIGIDPVAMTVWEQTRTWYHLY